MSERQLAEKEQEIQQLRHEKDIEIATLRQQMADDRAAWDQERADIEDEKMDDLTRLHDENDRLRSQSSTALTQSTSELTLGLATLQTLIKTHGIVLFSRDSSLQGLLLEGFFGHWCVFFLLVLGTALSCKTGPAVLLCTMCRQKHEIYDKSAVFLVKKTEI
ncbi:hypothetical protein B0H34DRAFT_689807 [Crassisporium funariophilum]|nr:hypothetical protein B0H34DRAFT_689807 [Crassisporium funariophilum]